jgi:hypothetical protein
MEEVFGFLRENASLVVSICALALTLASIWGTRKHNRLMVRPRLATFTSKRFSADDPSTFIVKSTLRNSGLGPAIINEYAALLDGVKIEVQNSGEYFQVFAKTIRATPACEPCFFSHLNRGYVMAKDEVLEVAHVGIKLPLYPELERDLKRFQLRVTYESAYGESFVYDSRDHQDVHVVESPATPAPTPLTDIAV